MSSPPDGPAGTGGIDDQALAVPFQAHQKAGRIGQGVGLPAEGAGHVKVKDAQRLRRARPPVDDPGQDRVVGSHSPSGLAT